MTEKNDRRNESKNDFYGYPAAYRGGRFSEDACATPMAWSAFFSEAFPRNPILGFRYTIFLRAPTQLHTAAADSRRTPELPLWLGRRFFVKHFRGTRF